jgi:uncharacterized protein YecE (DUF72 family)
MEGQEKIHIGTSGWHYEHWRGPFYPEHLDKSGFLKYYADRFHTVEINNSFYQLPRGETIRQWKETVPSDFMFSLKASRYITHMKKLKDPGDTLPALLRVADALGGQGGPILFQLPPRWRLNGKRFEQFLEALPSGRRYAFEFRDATWFDPGVYDALTKGGAAFCIYELAGQRSPKEVTADFVYIRLHGPAGAYQGQYDGNALAGWAGALSAWTRQGKEVFCYFDNDQAGYAAHDALRLQEMIRG